jgi:6-phosphofructokinase 1
METTIESLGPARFRSPLHRIASSNVHFRTDAQRVLMDDTCAHGGIVDGNGKISFEVAGPRAQIFFDPPPTTAGIVTCGGLCPGLNDVIRGLVMELTHRYGVTKVYGFRYGFEGLVPRYGQTPMILKPDSLDAIHAFGGTILGTSRGPQDVPEMVNFLEEMEVDILFVVGGDGSLRGAN